MPELPEVETIRRGLLEQVLEKPIRSIVLQDCRIFHFTSSQLTEALLNQSIGDIRRRGKFLIFELPNYHWLVHLGMTGQLTVRQPDQPDGDFHRHPATGLQRARQHAPDKHTHLQLTLDDGRALFYRDPRKFGRMELFSREAGALETRFVGLGLEPFSQEYQVDAFVARLRHRKSTIKALLLNQGVVAGVGNIYADEALFAAGIHPARRAHRIRVYEKKRLFETIREVLAAGIHFGGTSLRDYLDSDGLQGSNQDELLVYGRAGQPCSRCGKSIEKIVVSQRGTHFCPRCQPRNP